LGDLNGLRDKLAVNKKLKNAAGAPVFRFFDLTILANSQ